MPKTGDYKTQNSNRKKKESNKRMPINESKICVIWSSNLKYKFKLDIERQVATRAPYIHSIKVFLDKQVS